MEAHIKFLEKWIKEDRETREIKDKSKWNECDKYCERICISIENVIARIADLDQVNESHKTINCELSKRLNSYNSVIDEKIKQTKKDLDKATEDFTENRKTFADVRYYFGKLQAFEEIKKELEG